MERSVALSPSYAKGHYSRAFLRVCAGLAPGTGHAATFASLDLPGLTGDETIITFEEPRAEAASRAAIADNLSAAWVRPELEAFADRLADQLPVPHLLADDLRERLAVDLFPQRQRWRL